MNQVDRWFGLLTDKLIRRGVHTSVKALEDDITAWIVDRWASADIWIANRTLTVDGIAALTYWPGIIWRGQKDPAGPVDLTGLPPLLQRGSAEYALEQVVSALL